jgi:hypothetical protein
MKIIEIDTNLYKVAMINSGFLSKDKLELGQLVLLQETDWCEDFGFKKLRSQFVTITEIYKEFKIYYKFEKTETNVV